MDNVFIVCGIHIVDVIITDSIPTYVVSLATIFWEWLQYCSLGKGYVILQPIP
jgi:hypothetical protein